MSIKYIIGGDLQYIRLKGIKPPFEQLIFKDGGRPPKDITTEDLKASDNYMKYKKIVD